MIALRALEFAWMNPHSYIVMDVKGTHWKMEAELPSPFCSR